MKIFARESMFGSWSTGYSRVRGCLFLFAISFCLPVQAGLIELKGSYQGENLYVKNPFSAVGVGFCVFEVTVNGMVTTDEVNSSAFEIDLTVYGLLPGQPVVVRINHREGCSPRVINPGVLNPRATFATEELRISGESITWTTRDESGSLPFVVEQFRWNKWISAGEVTGKGLPGTHTYSLPVILHSGDNRFRVRQSDGAGNMKLSPQLIYTSTKERVSYSISRDNQHLTFSNPTLFELFDGHGRIVTKGYGDLISLRGLKRGQYFLNFDNQMTNFTIR